MSSSRGPAAERSLRHLGASILSASALISAPFVLFALSYKTYMYCRTGHWYAWGAPTRIGVCNRVISYALIVLSIIGITFLTLGHALGHVRRRRTAAPRTTSPTLAHPTLTAPSTRTGVETHLHG